MMEKMEGCEYSKVDKTSDPCHNPAVFIHRAKGVVVCTSHVESLEKFFEAKDSGARTRVVTSTPAPTKSNKGFPMTVIKTPGAVIPGLG